MRGVKTFYELIVRPFVLLARWLFAPIDKLSSVATDRSVRNERALVNEPRRAHRLMLRDLLWLVVALACVFARPMVGDGALWALSCMLVGWFVGMGALARTRRAQSYRSGWLAGRSAMVGALAESQRRGMHPNDWLRGEFTRDAAMLGIPLPPDDEEGPQ